MNEERSTIRSREELKAAYEAADKQDLNSQADQYMERLKKQKEVQDRIKSGLSRSGKKLRKNALCPCESGRKFKRCCLPKLKAKQAETISNATKAQNDNL